jgi:hypothetical protein
MIPHAVAQVFRVAEELQDKGWTYMMEGWFLEIVSRVSLFPSSVSSSLPSLTSFLASCLHARSYSPSLQYNETITNLLSPPPAAGDPPCKHEIHHHLTTHLTSISDVLTPVLILPTQVLALLAQV